MTEGQAQGARERSEPLGCRDARVLLMGYIDGELGASQRQRVEDHLAVCVQCRGDERAYRQLGEMTGAMIEEGLPVDTDRAWERIYDRIARGVGWILLWIGLTLMGGYGVWQLFSEFLFDSSVPLALRAGVGSLAAGALLLLVSIVRERLFRDRSERYREVQR